MKLFDRISNWFACKMAAHAESSQPNIWFKMRVYDDEFKGEDERTELDLLAVVRGSTNEQLKIVSEECVVYFGNDSWNEYVFLETFPDFTDPRILDAYNDMKNEERRLALRTGEQIRFHYGLDVELAISIYNGTFSGCQGRVEILDPDNNIIGEFDFKGLTNLEKCGCLHIASIRDGKLHGLTNRFKNTKGFLGALGLSVEDTSTAVKQQSAIPHPAHNPPDQR